MSKSDGIGRTCDTPKKKALIYFKGSSRSDTGREGEGGSKVDHDFIHSY